MLLSFLQTAYASFYLGSEGLHMSWGAWGINWYLLAYSDFVEASRCLIWMLRYALEDGNGNTVFGLGFYRAERDTGVSEGL